MPRSLPESACMRSGADRAHGTSNRNTTHPDRGSHVSRPPRATPSVVTVPTPPGRGGGASGARSGPCWDADRRIEHVADLDDPRLAGLPPPARAVAAHGHRAGAGHLHGGGPPLGRGAARVRRTRCARSWSPTRTPTRYARRRRARCTRCRAARSSSSPACTSIGACWPPADRPGAARASTSWPARRAGSLVLEAVNDHENIGALFRNAAAFGVDGGGARSDRRRPALPTGHPGLARARAAGALRPCRRPGRRRSTTCGRGLHRSSPSSPRADEPLADLVADRRPSGSPCCSAPRGTGLSAAALAAVDRRVRIPMAPGVDSVNVATAAAIALAALFQPPR